MPLCPQITNTPITVSLTADYTVTNVVPVLPATTEQLAATDAAVAAAAAQAASAAATAGTAQSTANTALANAATAYTAAIGSLQPSASTIVNASNQMTAIAANGITVYSGSSSSSGARVVLNSTGLAGFDSGGTATFSISASTGAAVFSGSVTGSTITGGTLNIAGNAIINSSGLLTATGATITGTINATAGYFGTASNGFSISSTGLVGVGTGTIVGGTISTSSANNRIIMGSSSNSLSFYYNGNPVAHMVATTGGAGVWLHNGATASPSTRSYPLVGMSTSDASLEGSSTYQIVSSSTGNVIYGAATLTSSINVNASATFGTSNTFEYLSSSGTLRSLYTYGVARTASTRTMIIDSSGNFGTTASTRRKKHEIQSYKIDSNALLNLDIKTFKYKPEFDPNQQVQHGFIAEEAQELGLDELIQYDATGVPDYFAYEKLPIFLLQLAQEQEARIQALEGK